MPVIRLPLAALLSCLTVPVSAAVRYVDRDATGAKNGTSWANAYTTLQAAVTAAVSGDQVWIAAGTYRPNDPAPANLDRTLSFSLKRGVSIYGGFAGTETAASQRNPKLNPVILSGDLLGNDSAGNLHALSSDESKAENVFNVFNHTSSLIDSSAVLDSVTVRGGNANGNSGANSSGGGMYNSAAAPSLMNCEFVDNSATYGGAVYNRTANPSASFRACTFSHSKASQQGGALFNQNAAPILINCTLAENYGNLGGAIFNSTASLMAINCTIAFNSSALITAGNGSGSGIRSTLSSDPSRQSSLFLYNCILWGNQNSVQLFGGKMTISNCILQGGSAEIVSEAQGNSLTNIFSTDPQLTPLGDHGGSTHTAVFPANSPAINAGTTSTGSTLYPIPTADQRGIVRDAQPDIGATEHPVYGGPGAGQVAIGGSATLPVSTSLSAPTFQWYRGTTGDTSDPLVGETGNNYSTPPLGQGTDYWVAVTSGGETYASPTIPVPVRGTFPQWVAFHELAEEDAGTDACPAGDGVPNLIKYATGLPPFSPADGSSCLRTSLDPVTGNVLLDLTLSRTPTDLAWGILESPDFREWAPAEGTPNPVTTSTARQTHRLSVPPTQSAGFFKARFERIE